MFTTGEDVFVFEVVVQVRDLRVERLDPRSVGLTTDVMGDVADLGVKVRLVRRTPTSRGQKGKRLNLLRAIGCPLGLPTEWARHDEISIAPAAARHEEHVSYARS